MSGFFFKSSKPVTFEQFRSHGEFETTLLLSCFSALHQYVLKKSSVIYVSVYTECAGKDTDGHCCLQYSLQEIKITFILKIISQSCVFMVLFCPTNSLKPKDTIF